MEDDAVRLRLTLSQYRVLRALDEQGGFSAAATALGISQPSVSAQLRAIEDKLRLRVFERRGHNLSLTPLGRELMPRIRGLTALADELDRILGDHMANRAGRLSIGYSTHQFVMPVISEFMKRYPGISLSAGCMASADVLDKLQRGLFDVAFVTGQFRAEGLSYLLLRREKIVLMVPRDHPVAGRSPLSWDELTSLPLIGREPASGTRQRFDTVAADSGQSFVPVLELGSWESMRAAVRSGIGLGVVMAGEIEPGDEFACVEIDDGALWVEHHLVASTHLRSLAAVDALFEVATKYRESL